MAGQQHKSVCPEGNAQLETRLLVVAEMLERAVAEVRRAMAEIKSGDGVSAPADPQTPVLEEGESDGSK